MNPDTCRIRVDGQIFESGKKKYVWAAPYSLRATIVQGLASIHLATSFNTKKLGPTCWSSMLDVACATDETKLWLKELCHVTNFIKILTAGAATKLSET